jgi:hypothetical protein
MEPTARGIVAEKSISNLDVEVMDLGWTRRSAVDA